MKSLKVKCIRFGPPFLQEPDKNNDIINQNKFLNNRNDDLKGNKIKSINNFSF